MTLSEKQKSKITRAALEIWARSGKQSVLPVQGWSMWPTLRRGDSVAIRHGGPPPRVGEIAVVRIGDRSVAHRVLAVRRIGTAVEVRLKGDRSLLPDRGWFGPDQIVGLVEGRSRDGRVLKGRGLNGRLGVALAWLSRLQAALLLPVAAAVEQFRSLRARRNRPEAPSE